MAKQPSRSLALLRGINVGGKNIIAKQDLVACFESLGFSNVKTYIQSGNILFRSSRKNIERLTIEIEKGLSKRFNYDAQAVVLSYDQYRTAVGSAPKKWGRDENRKHNACFTLRTTTPQDVLAGLPPPKPRIDTVATGPGVIFWSASKKDVAKSTMMKLGQSKFYQMMTVRNHNTVFKLLELFEEI